LSPTGSIGDKKLSFQTELRPPRSNEFKFVDELALDQIDSTDGIEGTDDPFSDPIEFNDANVCVLVKLGLTGFGTGFEGQSILSLSCGLDIYSRGPSFYLSVTRETFSTIDSDSSEESFELSSAS